VIFTSGATEAINLAIRGCGLPAAAEEVMIYREIALAASAVTPPVNRRPFFSLPAIHALI
jgi:hypothetical protein